MLYDDEIVATNISNIDEFLRKLETEFQITSGSLEYFLNMLIKHDQNGSIFISQKTYAKGEIRQFNMEEPARAKSVSTPIEKELTEKVAGAELTAAPSRSSRLFNVLGSCNTS